MNFSGENQKWCKNTCQIFKERQNVLEHIKIFRREIVGVFEEDSPRIPTVFQEEIIAIKNRSNFRGKFSYNV